ncbi:L,D-transpeptidase family protein [Flavobacterium sp. TP390]|uniref:L,D-transpeptidase family protein n=1 Tax=Flavobacterium profundi TaxID=1774945 RepID=A0A6I4IT30_9FLAO|nr:L,D-transpeptidase [Flavobacterium profundi]MVO10027.1 L,D-transpeptidase family protein [Flavobacterium profundi]
MKRITGLLFLFFIAFTSCNKENTTEQPTLKRALPERTKPKNYTYSYLNTKEMNLDSLGTKEMDILLAVNRMDETHLKKTDSILVPTDLTGDLEFYLPFPFEVKALDSIKKIIFFSYPSESFATYEYGILTHVGPTNMGKETAITPTGLFYTNWKAEETTSTVNDEWLLKWNFNVANNLGVGFHQYELPGFPASHSCMRLREKDAKMLFDFAEQWVLENDDKVKIKGTPVIIFGKYDFNAPKPWFALKNDPEALKITEEELETVLTPHLEDIKKEEKIRDEYQAQQG